MSKYSFIKTQQWRSTKYSFAANIVLTNIDHLSLTVFVLPYLKRFFLLPLHRHFILHCCEISCQGRHRSSTRNETVCLVVCCYVGEVPNSLQSRSHGASPIAFMKIYYVPIVAISEPKKVSFFKEPPLPMPLVMDAARLKTITYHAI